MVQAIGAGAAIVYSVIVTFIILKVIDVTVGLRVDSDGEQQGLDVVEHSEVGYNI
jgi:Amt family ammonium transporter